MTERRQDVNILFSVYGRDIGAMSFLRGFKVSPSKSRIVVFSLFGPRKTKKVKKSLKNAFIKKHEVFWESSETV